jgi:tetratricopeptide (TPR) repeat protein
MTSNGPPPPPEVIKLPPEPVIKVTPDDKPVVRTPAPVPALNAASNHSLTTTKNAEGIPPEKKGILSKLNPFRRETKPVAQPVAVTSAPPEKTLEADSASGRYVSSSPAVPTAGERKSAEQALAQGQRAQRAGRLAEAMQYYRLATQLDGSYFEAHYSLGLAAFTARSFKAAAAAWETAIAIRPDSRDARYNLALALKATGQPQEAADELEKLLALHPDEARGHLTLGNLYAELLGDKPRARRHYQQVLQLDPRNPQASAIRYWLVANPG